MKRFMLATAALVLIAAGSALAQVNFGVGIRIGPPPRVRVERVVPSPGPGFVWIDGYWYADGGRWKWHKGYWTQPPYAGARWVAARHDGAMFYEGYWEGDRGHFGHDHRWDRDHNRDRDRFDHH